MTRCRTLTMALAVGAVFLGNGRLAAQEQPAADAPRALVVVLVRQLNFREAPGLDASVVGFAARGDTLCAFTFTTDWVEVRSPLAGDSGAQPRGYVARGLVSEVRASVSVMRDAGCVSTP